MRTTSPHCFCLSSACSICSSFVETAAWWQPVFLLVLAALLAMLQLPAFLHGLNDAVIDEVLHTRALAAPALVSNFVSIMTNGLLDPSSPLDELLLVSLPVLLALFTFLRLRRGNSASAIWLLVFASAALLSLVIVINEVLRILPVTRIRYIMPLWPMTALLVGAGLWRLANRHRILATGMLALWLISGAWLTAATDYRYGLGYFLRIEPNHFPEILNGHFATTDLLLVDYSVSKLVPSWFGVPNLGINWEEIYRYKEDPYESGRSWSMPTIPICGCSTSQSTRWWASQIAAGTGPCVLRTCAGRVGASHSNATPCIPWKTARTGPYAWSLTPASS